MKTKLVLLIVVITTSINCFGQNISDPLIDTNLYQIETKFNSFFTASDSEEDGLRTQFNRWKNYWEPRLFPSGNFQPAYHALSDYTNNFNNENRISSTIQANWNNLGPSYPTGPPIGGVGRITCLAFHPTNNNMIFAGSMSGGVWKTNDGGLNWFNLNTDFQLPKLGISAITVDPANPNYIYIGSGMSSSSPSIGIYRSSDGGNSWVPVNSNINMPIGGFYNIQKLLIDPINTNIIYAATDGGIFKTINAKTNCTWTLLPTLGQSNFYNIQFGSSNINIYASGTDVIVSNDGGATWNGTNFPFNSSPLNGQTIDRINIDNVYITGNLYLYALINVPSFGKYLYFYNGTTWVYKNQISASNYQRSFANDARMIPIAISPSQPNIVFMGTARFAYSLNGGSSITVLNYNDPCHADFREIKFQPSNPNTLYLGNDGGICKYDFITTPTFSSSASWRSNGLETATVLNISSYSNINPDRDLILSGHFDDGSNLYDSYLPVGQQWDYKSSGDGFEQIIDYNDFNTMYSTTFLNCTNCNGTIYPTYNAFSSYGTVLNQAEPAIFGAPLAIDTKTPTTLYQGRTNIWRTDDKWQNKYKISDFVNENQNGYYQVSVAITVALNDPNYIYSIANADKPNNLNYRLFKTSTGGNINGQTNQWTNITPPFPQYSSAMKAVAVSDKNPNHIWVCYSGYDPNYRIKKSADGGLTWSDYNTGLPSFPINHIVYERGSNDGLYIATDVGIYYRNKYMTQWEPFNNNLPNVECTWIDLNYTVNKIRLATYGRGVWQSHLACPNDFDLTLSGIHPNYFYETEHDIYSTAEVNSSIDVTYRGGNAIELNPGFIADAGSNFIAYIHPCNSNGNTLRVDNSLIDDTREPNAKQYYSSNDLIIYPNPNKGSFKLVLPSNTITNKVEVFDLTGRIVWSKNSALEVSGLNKGSYIIKSSGPAYSISKIIIVN